MSASLYLQVFYESAWNASIIPLSSEAAFYAMRAFGGYNMGLAFAMALPGAVIGQMFNWYVGQYLLKLKNKGKFEVNQYWYDKVARLFIRYGVFSLFFSWAPLCNVLVVIAGFVNVRPKMALPLIILGQIFYYGQWLF